MFLVSDTIVLRQRKIRSFLKQGDLALAVILSAIDFEWSTRRAIKILASGSSKEVQAEFDEYRPSNPQGYSRFWKNHVCKDVNQSISEVVGLSPWNDLLKAYEFRNKLVHGYQGTIHPNDATRTVDAYLNASNKIVAYVESLGCSVYKRLSNRTKQRTHLVT